MARKKKGFKTAGKLDKLGSVNEFIPDAGKFSQ